MAVDPATLRGYRPPEEPPPGRGGGPAAALVALIGSGVLAGLYAAGRDHASVAQFFLLGTLALDVIVTAALVVTGWNEDGVLGVWYRLRHPLGTALVGDDRAPWMWYAVGWLLLLASVLSLLLAAEHPGLRFGGAQ